MESTGAQALAQSVRKFIPAIIPASLLDRQRAVVRPRHAAVGLCENAITL
nr:MAG TPA: hypothetical protein [Caudoviricetes sp.]